MYKRHLGGTSMNVRGLIYLGILAIVVIVILLLLGVI